MVMRFGKYQGCHIRDVPRDYLEWMKSTHLDTLKAIDEELERRDRQEEAKQSWMERIVTAGYRQLALQNHPDHGGKTEDMKEINIAVERLRAEVKKVAR